MNDFPEKVQKVLDLWKTKKENYRDAWNNNGGWPAKNVSIEFTFEGKDYVVTPDTIGLEKYEPWDEGFMEFINTEIGKDLKDIGATDVAYFGMLD